MIKSYIVKELINEMKDRMPQDHSLASYLINTLCIGKEAAYRRLRGEVAFTLDEIAIISCNLGISIDQIIGNHLANRVTFNMNLLHKSDLLESYHEIIEHYHQLLYLIKGDDNTEIYTASNTIPFVLYSSYEYLTKFRLCQWIYQNGEIQAPNSLSEVQIPEKLIIAHKRLSESAKKSGKTYFIWDNSIFHSFVKEIQYFAGLKLISAKDVIQLKKELQQLLTDLEYLSVKGEFNNGNKLSIYLSNINFETTYSYISKKNFEVSLFSIYSLNSMDSQNPHICRMQKKWIQSLKRHSTQISESGETQRIAFLEKQKNIIAAL